MPGYFSSSLPPIPPLFTQKKENILKGLAVPSEAYTDLSPKGSIDADIRDLINRINKLEGIVTTSSCAGRVSVFLEGAKTRDGQQRGDCSENRNGEMAAKAENGGDDDEEDDGQSNLKQASVPGGKGKGGRWLFSSHEPVNLPEESESGKTPVSSIFGLKHPDGALKILPDSQSRFVNFQFEPMILHIMTASLHHAQPVLSAAINAGFRESGVQSLKNLDDANSFPMVAIRTSGLALSSLIGFATNGDGPEFEQALVDDNHLRMLLQLANDRFKANAERIKRFEEDLFKKFESRQGTDPDWEDAKTRRERKRAEGLREQERFQRQPGPRSQGPELSLE